MPDFRGRMEIAVAILSTAPPDVFNHNLETVPRLYKQARPGADYRHSLQLLQAFKARNPQVPTKSGLMVGLGETDDEILDVMRDMRAHPSSANAEALRAYSEGLQASRDGARELALERYTHAAQAMGFAHAACAPLVRSSYHADLQAHDAGLTDDMTPHKTGRTCGKPSKYPSLFINY